MNIFNAYRCVVLAILLLALTLQAEGRRLGGGKGNQEKNEGVRVQATGIATGKPDAVSIHYTVTVVKPTNEESLSDLTKTAKAIKAKLSAANLVNDQSFSSNQLSTSPEYKYDHIVKENNLVGYRCSQSYSLLVKEAASTSLADQSAAAVGMIVQAGGDMTRVNSVIPIITNKDKLAKEARETAVKNALDKAKDYARLLGTSLGAVVYINEIHSPEARGGGGGGMMRKASYAAMEIAADGPPDVNIDLGEKETRVSIEVQWRLSGKGEEAAVGN